ncbi:MAG: group II intron reverse transcriptase domain-containing protein [Nannocystis sp.]|nr:group II intron reverse transcriptase domain-containing protein [Nannocystis sp.]
MRRVGEVFGAIAALENLWGAWRDFQRGKRGRPAVQRFRPQAAEVIVRLTRDLVAGEYAPFPYRLLRITTPKRRLIAAAAVRDRVVHHAVHRVLAPLLDPGLSAQTYACLPGKGLHRALLAFIAGFRRYRWHVHLDIRAYFPSVDRGILLEVMARRVKDRRALALLGTIAESGAGIYEAPGVAEFLGLEPGFPPAGCGLPIGNLTSQWWGNHYLAGLDHFVMRELKAPFYQRYMDDFVLMGDDASALERQREAIARWLAAERRLTLKDPGAVVRGCAAEVLYLGQRVSRVGWRPRGETMRRFERRVRGLVAAGDVEAVERSVASYRGVLGLRRPPTLG